MRRRALWRVDASQADRVSQLLNDDGPALDTAEQAELVQAFEAAHAAQSRLWRLCFAAVGALLGVVLLWFGLDQLHRPWVGYRHHSVFHRTAPVALVAVAELLSGATLMAAAAVLSARVVRPPTARQGRKDDVPADATAKSWQRWESTWALRVLCVAAGLSIFWAWALAESLGRQQGHRPSGGQVALVAWWSSRLCRLCRHPATDVTQHGGGHCCAANPDVCIPQSMMPHEPDMLGAGESAGILRVATNCGVNTQAQRQHIVRKPLA